MTVQTSEPGALNRPSPTGLADVIETILDKGMVIDLYVRVSLVGIELVTVDARLVVASVDTYLRFAEAVNRLDLSQGEQHGLPDLVGDLQEGGAESKTKGALDAVGEKVGELTRGHGRHDDEDDDYEDEDEEADDGRKPERARASSRRRDKR